MDEKKKKKLFNKIMSRIFLFFLIAFTALYVSEATGYYEFEQHNKKVLTERFVTLKHIDIHNKIGGNSHDIRKYSKRNGRTNYDKGNSR